jgi:hypothetical protein
MRCRKRIRRCQNRGLTLDGVTFEVIEAQGVESLLAGWVNYFAVGHSSECFSYIKDWVEKKVRRQLAQARKRKGFCWSGGIGRGYTTLSGCLTAIECDTTDRKLLQLDRSHKPWNEANGSAQCGKSACCVRRGGGWKRGTVERPAGAPVLDPTCERLGVKFPGPTRHSRPGRACSNSGHVRYAAESGSKFRTPVF